MAYDFRRFAAATVAVDQTWSTSAVSGDTWQETGHRWNTNTGPAMVKNAGGLQAVKKPGSPTKGNLVPAREKIVADLAYLLGLPVPPVTLWDTGGGAYAAVSAWAFEKPSTWGQIKGVLGGVQGQALVPAMSAMLPFETWVGAQDRQNEGNVLVAVAASGEPVGAWIDYAFSLDHVWGKSVQPGCAIAPHYPPVGAPDMAIVRDIADRIAAIQDDDIGEIVNRVPEDCLPADVAEVIRNSLLARRATQRALW